MLLIIFNLATVVAGFFVLKYAADYLVDYGIYVAKKFNLSEGFVGIVMLSVGTSLPEFFTCFYAVYTLPQNQSTNFVISNVLGSNISNLGMVFAFALLFSHLPLPKTFYKKHLLRNFLALLLFFIVAYGVSPASLFNKEFFNVFNVLQISRWEGALLLAAIITYLYISYKEKRLDVAGDEVSSFPQYFSKWQGVLYLLIALAGIFLGSKWIVDGAFFIAVDLLKIDEKIIVITLVAFGTSLPELATSVSTIKKQRYGLFLGNIMGSNMFNILFVVGLSSVFVPLRLETTQLMGSSVVDFGWFFLFLLILAVGALLQKGVLTKKTSLAMFMGYTFFVIYLLKIAGQF